MRIEYIVSLGRDGAKIIHRVVPDGDADGKGGTPGGFGPDGSGGTPGGFGPDGGGGTPGGFGPDGGGGTPGGFGPDGSGGTPGGFGPDGGGGTPGGFGPDGGGGSLGSGGETIIVLGPTIITGGAWRQGTSGAKPLPEVPSTFTVESVANRPAGKTLEGIDPKATHDVISDAKMRGQEHWYWCWAAVGSAVRKFMDAGQPLTQCEVADMMMADEQPGAALPSCCSNPGPSNLPKSLWTALKLQDNLHQGLVGGVASFDLIQKEIAAGRPIGARISWDTYNDGLEDGAHFVLIAGWEIENGVEMVKILDPAVGLVNQADAEKPRVVPIVEPNSVPYEQFRHAYKGTGKWVVSYFVKGMNK